jgi:hypothetical protein
MTKPKANARGGEHFAGSSGGLRPLAPLLTVVGAMVSMGCGGGPASIAPVGLAPADRAVVDAWVAEFLPRSSRLYSVRPWRFINEQGAAAGRATMRVAPPDSLRFDYSGPFRRSGKAAVVGDSALWVVPEEQFGTLVSVAPIFWAALGLPQKPPAGRDVFTLQRDSVRAWSYVALGDTLNFVVRGEPATRILAEMRRRGRTFVVADVEIDPATGMVTSSQIDFPTENSRFEFTVESVDTTATFDASVWVNP